MAKLLGPFQFSGKLGQTVGMKGANGENYVRVKVNPTNKKSQLQVDRRVKFALAGLLSKLTDQALIIGMGNTTRDRRNNFTSNIARMATTRTESDGTIRALLKPAELLFSEGRLIEVPETLSTTFNGTSLSVAFSGTLPEDMAGLLVIGVFSENNYYTKVDGLLITPDALTGNIPGNGDAVNVYVIPVVRAANASSTAYQRAVEDIATSNDYAAAARGALAGSLYYGSSVFQSRVDRS